MLWHIKAFSVSHCTPNYLLLASSVCVHMHVRACVLIYFILF